MSMTETQWDKLMERPRSPEVAAAAELLVGVGFRVQCRFRHTKANTCQGSVNISAARRRGAIPFKVRTRCKDGIFHVFRPGGP